MNINLEAITEKLITLTGAKIIYLKSVLEPSLFVPPKNLFGVMERLREEREWSFEVLMSQTGMHENEQIRLFYHLYSLTHQCRLTIETETPLENPEIESVAKIWKSANWLERETYDLLGVRFKQHPDLRRILLPEDWKGHPLRKDYQSPESYNGINNAPSKITLDFKVD